MEVLRLAVSILAWPLACGVLAAGLLAQGGRFSVRLDVLTHFAPFYLAAALLALTLSPLSLRNGRLALAATAALGAAAGATRVAPEFLVGGREPRAQAHGSADLKLVQFNAWGGNRSPAAAVGWIRDEAPDVVVLEEGGRVRDPLAAQGYAIACGDCATVILARERPIRTQVLRDRDGKGFIVAATFRRAAGDFTVVGVHRSWPTRFARARAQTADLEHLLASLPKERLILAGDFNSTPWSFARRREDRAFGLIRRTRFLPTWPAARLSHNRLPAPFPYLPIDHVYAGAGWATVSVRRGPRLGSDHYPVVVTLASVEPAPA